METNDATQGGILNGDAHSDPSGGIQAVIVDTDKPVLLESGEVVINKEAVKEHHELLSAINQSAGNGVPILDPNKVYGKGGNIDDLYTKWSSLVNMSASELRKFYDSDEGKKAGLTEKEAKEEGVKSGRESARWIIKMKNTPKAEWTPTMEEWANRQISFISRMSGVKGDLYDEKGNKTRKHLALLIWGHDPEKPYKAELGMGPQQTELQKGIQTEQEHKDTLQKLASGKIDVPAAIEQTAKDHLKEDPQYYTKLKKMENLPITTGTIIINNEASNDEKTWIIQDIKDGEILLSHITKFAPPKGNITLPFSFFLSLYNDRIISIPTIDELGLENFEAKKLIVELAIGQLILDSDVRGLNRRIEDALEETKRARAELMDVEYTEEEEEFSKGGNIDANRIPSLEKHWKGMSKKNVEEYAEYLGNLKTMWNKKEIALSKPRLKEITAYQIFINENHPEFNHYLTKQAEKMERGGNIASTVGEEVQKYISSWKSYMPRYIIEYNDGYQTVTDYDRALMYAKKEGDATIIDVKTMETTDVYKGEVGDTPHALSALKTLLPTLKGKERKECLDKIKELSK